MIFQTAKIAKIFQLTFIMLGQITCHYLKIRDAINRVSTRKSGANAPLSHSAIPKDCFITLILSVWKLRNFLFLLFLANQVSAGKACEQQRAAAERSVVLVNR